MLAENLKQIEENIQTACLRAGSNINSSQQDKTCFHALRSLQLRSP